MQILEDGRKIIYHLRKLLLFEKENALMKKLRDLFDVEIGAYDGAEVCEPGRTFLLEKVIKICNKTELDYLGLMVYWFLETKVVLN